MSKLSGTSLVGSSVNFKRVDNDFYATPPESVLSLLEVEDFNNGVILEPCCGQGRISKTLEKHTNSKVISRDLIDRGYGKSLRNKRGQRLIKSLSMLHFPHGRLGEVSLGGFVPSD